MLQRLVAHLRELNHQVQELEEQIDTWHRANEASQRLAKIPGIGPLTASALSASIGNAKSFKNGRELAAWLGLVPRQHSSGGKPMLLGISKRGDAYLRTLLIHGARSAVRVAEAQIDACGPVVNRHVRSASHECRCGGSGEQERQNRVGAVGTWTRLQRRLQIGGISETAGLR